MSDLPDIFRNSMSQLCMQVADASTRLTDFGLAASVAGCTIVRGDERERLAAVGIQVEGSTDLLIGLAHPDRRIGTIHIVNRGTGHTIMLGIPHPQASPNIRLRLSASNSRIAFPDMRCSNLWLPDVFLRSDAQTLFWGASTSAVHAQIELEGRGSGLFVGDDCMLSSGIWIRNHDMHTIFNVEDGAIINTPSPAMVIEQHVWIGQGALILGADRIGYGSIIGAMSLAKEAIPPKSLAVGAPARVIKQGVSWTRHAHFVDPETRELVNRLAAKTIL